MLVSYTESWAQYGIGGDRYTDTTLIIPNKDSLEQSYIKKDTVDSKFMDGVERSVQNSKMFGWISPSIFTKDKSFEENDSLLKEDYSEYNGKIVRNVWVKGLRPYQKDGLYPEDDDSPSWVAKLADATHMKTRNFILRNNLMIKPEDVFDSEMIINNLAYYRNLRYIYDARVIITTVPDSDYVDILFVVRDVWSIGFNLEKVQLKKINFEIFDRNIFGLGMELRTGMLYSHTNGKSYFGYSVSQSNENIKGSFFSSKAQLVDRVDKKLRHVSIDRNIQPHLKTVGGASYEYLKEDRYFITIDTIHQVKTETIDAWFGKVFNIGAKNSRHHSRLATMLRYEQRNLLNSMPSPSEPLYDVYEDRKLYIASVSLYRQQYYTDRLLFGFGINENIPHGYNITMQAGYEDHSYGDRFYTSVIAGYGSQHCWGYTYATVAAGGYIRNGDFGNGLFGMNLSYISPLIPVHGQAFRQFAHVLYERGIKRGIGEGSSLNYTDDLLFDLSNTNRSFFGSNKLTVSLESDFYSRVRLLGFRFVFFNFMDFTWLGNKTSIFKNEFLPGVGIGLRVRNDKLVFSTVQLKIGWYPRFPQSGFSNFYDISGVDRFVNNDFVPRKPQTLEFK